MSYSKIIGTPLSQLSDDDTVKEVIQTIATNQQSLYVQMMEIVKFFNAIYSPETDGETTFTSVINAGNIVRVTVKNGILYIAYKTDNDLRDVIKFKLSDVDLDPDGEGSGTGKSGFIELKHKGRDLPDPDEHDDGDYVFNEEEGENGGLYQKEDGGWVKKDVTEVYFFYDNSIYHYIDGEMTSVVDTSAKAKDMRMIQVGGLILDIEGIDVDDTPYEGDGGTILLYPGSVTTPPEVLLAVKVDTGTEIITEYHRAWVDTGRYPSSDNYDIRDWSKASFVWRDGGDLHMGSVSGVGEITELSGNLTTNNANPTKSSQTIKVYGDDYSVKDNWKRGELWCEVVYDEDSGTYTKTLKECITPNIDNLLPSFATVSFKKGLLYYVEDNEEWYAWSGTDLYEMSNVALADRITALEERVTILET